MFESTCTFRAALSSNRFFSRHVETAAGVPDVHPTEPLSESVVLVVSAYSFSLPADVPRNTRYVDAPETADHATSIRPVAASVAVASVDTAPETRLFG